MPSTDLTTLEQLHDIYGPYPTGSLADRVVLPSLHEHHRAFIAESPFLVIASADAAGNVDVSPKGDLPGFVSTPDEQTLVIPDRPGNNKILTLSNLVENPSVSLIFFVPGRNDTVRVNGKARITTDTEVMSGFMVKGRPPRSALIVNVEQAWHHCGKALIRSRLWDPAAQLDTGALPTVGCMAADQTELDAASYDAREQSWIDARRNESSPATDPSDEPAMRSLWGNQD